MNRYTLGALLAALLLSSATATNAGVSEDFAGCDGLKKPKKKDDGMRGVASTKGYSSFSLGGRRGTPERTIVFCNDAFDSGRLQDTQSLRRAHMLRARAAAYLELGKIDEALVDLDAAETHVANEAGNIFFQRSMGTSLKLLRAIAKSSLGENQEAASLAEEAVAVRPYALQVQMASSIVRHNARKVGDKSPSPWGNLLRLAPGWANRLISQEANIGNFPAVLEISRDASIKWPKDPLTPLAFLQNRNAVAEVTSALMSTLHTAYAYAVAGDTENAAEKLKLVDTKLSKMQEREDVGSPITKILKDKLVAPYARLIDARIALSEGRIVDARASINSGEIVSNAATMEFRKALSDAMPEDAAPIEMPGTDGLAEKLEKDRNSNIGRLASTVLIAPETKRAVIEYEKSRPYVMGALLGSVFSMGTNLLGGVKRTDGFRSKDNEDGTTTVEYTGNTTSAPLVQEMTLLRAAELARASKKSHFSIVDRKDYSRYQTVRQYNIEVSRTPIGYKSELTVRFLGSEDSDSRAFETIKVIDDLGPLYYER